MKDKDNELVVIKANTMIQNYKYTLSKQEIRVVNYIISNINSPKYDEELNVMEFNIADFYNLLEFNDVGGSDYKRLQQVLKNLSNKSSDYIDFGRYKTIVRWIEKPSFDEHNGTVKLKLDDDLKPFLLQANGFISAKLKFYFEMHSKYSMRLYELLKSWEKLREKIVDVEDLRINIDALQNSYTNYGLFKTRVLVPALTEINNITDISVQFEEIKKGRKVIQLHFFIEKNSKSFDIEENQMTLDDVIDIDSELDDDTAFFLEAFECFDEYNQKISFKKDDIDFYKSCIMRHFTEQPKTILEKNKLTYNYLKFYALYSLKQHKKSKKTDLKAYLENCILKDPKKYFEKTED